MVLQACPGSEQSWCIFSQYSSPLLAAAAAAAVNACYLVLQAAHCGPGMSWGVSYGSQFCRLVLGVGRAGASRLRSLLLTCLPLHAIPAERLSSRLFVHVPQILPSRTL